MAYDARGEFAVTHHDTPYTHVDGSPLLATVYQPENGDCARPLLVDVHGGAWTHFDRTGDVHIDTGLAAGGAVVVALDFRQGETGRYPRAVADIVAGIRWAKAHAETWGATSDRVGLVGGSSGGHLLMLAALRPSAPEYHTTPVDVPTSIDAAVAYALPLWPILDPPARYRYARERLGEPPERRRDRFFMPEHLIAGHDAFFGDEPTMRQASVQRIVEAGEAESLPPVWIAHPEHDENVTLAMTERFVSAYRAAGGTVTLEVFAGVGHSFANFPSPAADACIARMRTFVASQVA